MQKSPLFSVNWRDVVHGIIVAFGSAFLAGIYNSVSAGHLPTTWAELQPDIIAGTAGAVAYIGKNFFTNSAGNFGAQSNAAASLQQQADTVTNSPTK